MTYLIGRDIHGYEFRERIGSGGFGEVYRAYQPSVDREVAIKVIKTEYAEKPEFVARFEAEARTVAKLEHPHIVPLYDFWHGAEGAFLIMRYVKGGSLRDKLESEGAQNPEDVGHILDQICSALEAAHRAKVIHRDLKPENILLDEYGEAYITDFGIAKDLAADFRTKTGSFMGSLAYVAPEQVLGGAVSPETDIYALGILVFELLTGKHPFAGLTQVQLLQRQLEMPLPMLAELRAGLPAGYDELIQQATVKDPMERRLDAVSFAASFSDKDLFSPHPEGAGIPEFLNLQAAAPDAPHQIFVGRQRELTRMDGYLGKALNGRGQVAFVTGGPGRGKTALVSEFARQSRQRYPEIIVAGGSANAFSGLGDPYLPFRDILGMLTGDIEDKWAAGQIEAEHARGLWDLLPRTVDALVNHGPELIDVFIDGNELASRAAVAKIPPSQLNALRSVPQTRSGDGKNIQQTQLFEQYTSVLRELASDRPILLLLDDLQWADGASLSLLFHLGRRLENARILILGTYRAEEVALGRDGDRHPLEKVLTEFRQVFGEVRLDLSEEREQEGQAFIDALLDSEPNRLDKSFRDSLFERTGGHALFTLELLRSMQEGGDLVHDHDGKWVEGPSLDWNRLPERVEAVIEERIGRLEIELRDLLTVASVEGENFTVEVIAKVQEVNYRSTLRQLSQELEKRHHLIHERGDERAGKRILSRYRFSHQLFQRYLYNDLSAGERRLLHLEVAETLEGLYKENKDKITVQLARHYQLAGDNERARSYLVRAGKLAKRLFANLEAISHFTQALKLTIDQDEPYYELLQERASVLAQLYRGEEAVRDFQELLTYARENGSQGSELDALLGLGRGNYIIAIDNPEGGAAHASESYYGQAYELAVGLGDKRGMILALVPTIWFEDYWPEYRDKARANAEEALEISLTVDDEMLIIESELAMFYTDPLADRTVRGEQILQKLEEIGNLERLNYLHFGLMFSTLAYGEFESAVKYCDDGIALAKKIGVPPVQYPTIKATALIMLGRFDEAWEALQQEVADESHMLGHAFKDLGTALYYLELQLFEKAAHLLLDVIEQAEKLSRAWMQSSAHYYLVRSVVEGDLHEEFNLEKSLNYLKSIKLPSAAVAMGRAAFNDGDIKTAKSEIKRAKAQAEKTERRPGGVLALELECQINLENGDFVQALRSADSGLSLAESMNYRTMLWRLWILRSQALTELGRLEEAMIDLDIAADIVRRLAENIADGELKKTFLASPSFRNLPLEVESGG